MLREKNTEHAKKLATSCSSVLGFGKEAQTLMLRVKILIHQVNPLTKLFQVLKRIPSC